MLSREGYNPLLQDFFVKISANYMHMIFGHVTKILIQGSSYPRELWRDLFSKGVNKKFHLREFVIFFREMYMVARSYQALTADIKSLLINALVSLETRLKVPILAIFWRFLAFFKLSVLAQAFDLGRWLFH